MSETVPPPAEGSPVATGTPRGTTATFDRVPPHSLESEVSVLGAALLSANAASDVLQIVRPDHFYRNAHRLVFEAVAELNHSGEPIDTVTVTEVLSRKGRLDEVGGPAAIHDLTAAVPTAANASHYARIVRQKALLRRLIEAGTEVVRLGYEAVDDADTIVDRAESVIYDVAQSGADSGYARLGDLLTTSFDQIEKLAERGSEVTGLATGFNDLDRLTAGLQKQNLVIIAARPAMGKCLAGASTIVDAVTGRRWTIAELVSARPAQVRVTALDGDRLVSVRPTDFVANGVRETVVVRLASGRQVRATASHPLLTPEGWTRIADLGPGARVAVPRSLSHWRGTALASGEITMLARVASGEDPAAVLAPARAGARTPSASVGAPEFAGSGAGRTPSHALVVRTDPMRWRAWLRRFGIDHRPECQRVPQAVFTAPREQVREYLARVFSSPAATIAYGPDERRIAFAAPSELLIRDLQHLVLRFGVRARVGPLPGGDWQLEITGDAELYLFLFWVGLHTDRHRGDVLFGCLDLEAARPVAEAVRTGALQREWDPVVEVEEAGEEPVYDLTVPRLHNFVADDVIVHNSALALGVSHYVTTKLSQPAILFSLEMSKIEIVNRLLSTQARIDSSRLRTGRLDETDWRKLSDALGALSDAPLYIDDTPSISLNEIRAKCRRLQQKEGLDLVIVDYLQLMQSPRRIESRQQEVAEISRGLKMLAKELDVPVIALSQLSRQPEARTDKRPQLADLRESGSIEQDADIVGFIYRDEVYDENTPDRGIAELIISKHRNGATGVVRLAFLDHLTTFANLARGPARPDVSQQGAPPPPL